MSDETSPVPIARPEPPRSAVSRGSQFAHAWLAWFGLGRLVLAALSVVVVAGGAVWLLRPPPPTIESTLPYASASTTPASTLALPRGATSATETATTPESSDANAGTVVVHVAGAVANPGVYELAASARVIDAVTAAGGAVAEADTDRVNLAAAIADGQRIFVPAEGEATPVEVVVDGTNPDLGSGAAPVAGPLDLNTATTAELEQLPGIGPATASAIVEDRERNGPFSSVDELDRVSGIGPAKLESLVGLVTV